MRAHRSFVVAAVVLGGAGRAASQPTSPAYVRDGKVWFEVVEDGKRTDKFDAPARLVPPKGIRFPYVDLEPCHGVDARTPDLGVRFGSLARRADGPGTFTLETCSPATPGARDPRASFQQAIGDLVDAPGRRVRVQEPDPSSPSVILSLEKLLEGPLVRREFFFSGSYRRFDRTPSATVSSETFTFLRNGQVVGQEQGDTTPGEMNELFDMTYEEESAGVEFRFAPKVGRTITVFRAGIRSTDALLLYDVPQPAPGIRRTEWTGRGTDLEAGLDIDVPLSGGLYLEAGGRYSVLLETEVTRSPGLSASGGQITEDRGDLKRTTGSVRAALGYGWGDRAAVWAGAEAAWDTVRLTGSATAAFQQPSGLIEQRIEFTNEFESDGVRAFGGLEVRVAGPVFVLADYVGSSAGSTFVVGLGAGRRRR